MMNGPTLPEDFWEQLDKRFDKVFEKQDEMQKEISSIKAVGCAQLPNYSLRLQKVEDWKESTTSKFIGGLLAIIAALATSIYNLFRS